MNYRGCNLKIAALAAILIFIFIVSAWAVDFGIDKAVSLNFYFRNNERLISELKIDKLNIKGGGSIRQFCFESQGIEGRPDRQTLFQQYDA